MSDFEVVEKKTSSVLVPDPAISIQQNGSINILTKAYNAMGEPNAVRLHTDGERLAFEPTDRGDRYVKNAYVLSINTNDKGGVTSVQLGTTRPAEQLDFRRGERYPIEYDDETGFWIADPNNPYNNAE